jgi:glycine/D-amino acid oxidase-like deaminating enzyme
MLQDDLQCDVLVIGGGITGVTTALLLAEQGRKVVLLEAGEIGSGTTGHSTGNLYVTTSQGISDIASRWDDAVAREVVLQRKAAMDFVELQARQVPQALFTRCPLVLYARFSADQDGIDQERQALAKAGCLVRTEDNRAGRPAAARRAGAGAGRPGADAAAGLRGRAGPARCQGGRLAARAFARARTGHEVADGHHRPGSVKAGEIVLATHSPKGVHLVHAEMPVHREYAVAFEAGANDPGAGIFWWQGDEGLSIRMLSQDGKRYLVAAGTEQKAGTHNAKAALLAVENLATSYLAPGPAVYRWSAQNYRSPTACPTSAATTPAASSPPVSPPTA